MYILSSSERLLTSNFTSQTHRNSIQVIAVTLCKETLCYTQMYLILFFHQLHRTPLYQQTKNTLCVIVLVCVTAQLKRGRKKGITVKSVNLCDVKKRKRTFLYVGSFCIWWCVFPLTERLWPFLPFICIPKFPFDQRPSLRQDVSRTNNLISLNFAEGIYGSPETNLKIFSDLLTFSFHLVHFLFVVTAHATVTHRLYDAKACDHDDEIMLLLLF